MKERIPHGEVGHFCHGGCVGYAKGGKVGSAGGFNNNPLPPPGNTSPMPVGGGGGGGSNGINLIEILSALAGAGAGAGLLSKKFGGPKPSDMPQEIDRSLGDFKPDENVQMMAEGGVVKDEKRDPADIPEDIREFVEQAHKNIRESRPDETWRIKPMEKKETMAPYKKDEEEAKGENQSVPEMPHYDDGGQIPDPNQLLADLAPPGTGQIVPSPAPNQSVQPPEPPPIQAPVDATPTPPAPSGSPQNVPRGTTSALTDQDFMDRANKMLGLNPDQQASFMKLLGKNAMKGQIGAGIAGIGDAIAAGGTLGKVNPGNLSKSEDLIQNKTKEGLEGMQTIRGNQEKAAEMADKLEARDPQSPLSKWAQKAYAGVGKKVGLDLSNASAALIGDVTGKGVEALNTEYQGQLKQMGLQLQKEQVEATKANQEAERRQAALTAQQGANKTLSEQGIVRKGLNLLTPSGRASQKELVKEAAGNTSYAPDVMAYAQKHGITPEQAQNVKDNRTGAR